jgi:hypothetical protein
MLLRRRLREYSRLNDSKEFRAKTAVDRRYASIFRLSSQDCQSHAWHLSFESRWTKDSRDMIYHDISCVLLMKMSFHESWQKCEQNVHRTSFFQILRQRTSCCNRIIYSNSVQYNLEERWTNKTNKINYYQCLNLLSNQKKFGFTRVFKPTRRINNPLGRVDKDDDDCLWS